MSLADRRKSYFSILLVVLLLGVVGSYGYLKMRNLIVGPEISVDSPENGASLSQSTNIIRGMAKNVAYLSLDDRQIFVDEQGNFSEIVALLPGYNILSLKGEDKFGKKTEKRLELVLKE